MREIIIGPNDGGQRVDKFLSKAFPALPQSLLYKYIRLKRVKVNGARARLDDRLQKGDVLALYISDELLARPEAQAAWRTAPARVAVAYEDAHILIADKPQGLLCHEDDSGAADTLINRIKAYLWQAGGWDPEAEHSFAPALCHRIDRNTSGLVLAAKTAEALRVLNEQIRLRRVDKRYLCLCHGRPRPPEGTLRGYILRDKGAKQVAVLDRPAPGALTAVTDYRVADTRQGISLVACRLHTGRTHQIRAQLAHAGHPLVGDTKYGTVALNNRLPFEHQALHAHRLAFATEGDWGALDYLQGQSFEAGAAPFMPWFENLPQK